MTTTMDITVFRRENLRPTDGLFAHDGNYEVIVKGTSPYFSSSMMEWQPEAHEAIRDQVILVSDEAFDLAKEVLHRGLEAERLADLPNIARFSVESILEHQGLHRAVEYILDGCPELDDCIA